MVHECGKSGIEMSLNQPSVDASVTNVAALNTGSYLDTNHKTDITMYDTNDDEIALGASASPTETDQYNNCLSLTLGEDSVPSTSNIDYKMKLYSCKLILQHSTLFLY